jgi:hypothetical protein
MSIRFVKKPKGWATSMIDLFVVVTREFDSGTQKHYNPKFRIVDHVGVVEGIYIPEAVLVKEMKRLDNDPCTECKSFNHCCSSSVVLTLEFFFKPLKSDQKEGFVLSLPDHNELIVFYTREGKRHDYALRNGTGKLPSPKAIWEANQQAIEQKVLFANEEIYVTMVDGTIQRWSKVYRTPIFDTDEWMPWRHSQWMFF